MRIASSTRTNEKEGNSEDEKAKRILIFPVLAFFVINVNIFANQECP